MKYTDNNGCLLLAYLSTILPPNKTNKKNCAKTQHNPIDTKHYLCVYSAMPLAFASHHQYKAQLWLGNDDDDSNNNNLTSNHIVIITGRLHSCDCTLTNIIEIRGFIIHAGFHSLARQLRKRKKAKLLN